MFNVLNISRSFGFDAGHRILGHESKCANLHGHRYTAEIICSAAQLDPLGRVIDFSKIKELVGGWIDLEWDHTMILHRDDPLLAIPGLMDVMGPKPPSVLDVNPTAENMAKVLHTVANRLLGPHGIFCNAVKLWETPNCWAMYASSKPVPQNEFYKESGEDNGV